MRTAVGVAFWLLGASASPAQTAAERLFALEVGPLLEQRCAVCHGKTDGLELGGLAVTSRERLLAGGQSGEPTLSPGDAEASLLYQAVTWQGELRMPPKKNDRLSDEQVAWIREWIEAGAPWPDEETRGSIQAEDWTREETDAGARVVTSGGLDDGWTNRRYQPDDLWAFQPVRKPDVPNGAANPVDAFHRAKLTAGGLEPAPRADWLTLVRRAYYDLTGLPPTPQQVAAFLNDSSPDAWSRLVDQLLASPHYGEQWGRHWLDVVRYADTAGNSNDFERSNAWRYRDYVIRSFNADKPYNRFVLEQLAGDELEPDNPEMLVATGFLRMGPWGSAMVPKAIARQAYLDDVVNAVGQTFLATPLRCAKCHDHKFDPIPTRDYYRFYAAFATTQIAERPAAFLPEENQARFEEGRAHVSKLLAFATERKEALEKKRDDGARRWYAERGKPYVSAQDRKELPDSEKPPRNVGLTAEEEGRLKVRQQDEWIWQRRLERYEPMAQSVFSGPDYVPGNGRKLRVPERIDLEWRPDSKILMGGAVDAPGESVEPGVLSLISLKLESAPPEDPWRLTDDLNGRRLELAEWIADDRNALATRAIVNRVWQYHFGRGLAANPNNFGKTGGKPTHPELLDWLTADFIANGWSIKRVHRLIMTSDVYQQASEPADAELARDKDPNNELLSHFTPRRLTAEELRDSMLLVTGELNPELGGVPSMPEINMEVALQPRMIQFSIAPAHQPSPTPAERNRRSIYSYRVRGQADPFLEVFNQPNPNESCERRDSASVSPQALTLLNSDAATDRSIAFALRLEREADGWAGRIARAFELALGREAESVELETLVDYAAEMLQHHQSHPPKPQRYPTTVTRSLVEEFTGAPFEYEEILPVFEDYEADVKAWEVEPETRALADVCLVLLNSNEFAYVY